MVVREGVIPFMTFLIVLSERPMALAVSCQLRFLSLIFWDNNRVFIVGSCSL